MTQSDFEDRVIANLCTPYVQARTDLQNRLLALFFAPSLDNGRGEGPQTESAPRPQVVNHG